MTTPEAYSRLNWKSAERADAPIDFCGVKIGFENFQPLVKTIVFKGWRFQNLRSHLTVEDQYYPQRLLAIFEEIKGKPRLVIVQGLQATPRLADYLHVYPTDPADQGIWIDTGRCQTPLTDQNWNLSAVLADGQTTAGGITIRSGDGWVITPKLGMIKAE